MVPWICMPGHKGLTNTKLIWLLLGVCVVVFLIVVVRSPKQAKREGVQTEAVQKPVKELATEKPVSGEAAQKEIVPQKIKPAYGEPVQNRDDVAEVETLKARVTSLDPDMQMVMLDGRWYNSGSVDLSGIQLGNLVEVTYSKKKIAKGLTLINSIRVLGLPEEETQEESLSEKARLEEREEPKKAEVQTEDEPVEEMPDAESEETQFMEGRIMGLDPDMAVIVVDGVTFEAASYDSTGLQTPLVDLSGFQVGDVSESLIQGKSTVKWPNRFNSLNSVERATCQ